MWAARLPSSFTRRDGNGVKCELSKIGSSKGELPEVWAARRRVRDLGADIET